MSTRRSSRLRSRSLSSSHVPETAALPAKKRSTATDKSSGPPNKRTKKEPTAKAAKSTSPTTSSVLAAPDKDFKKPLAPATPTGKRVASRTRVPPLTPTPSLISVIRAPRSSGDSDDATPVPLDRPVEPHISSATLITPGGTQSVAYTGDLPSSTPSKTGLPRPTATTGNLLNKACEHLIKVDARMRPLVEKHTCHMFSPKGLAEEIDPFRSLSSGIIGQQVSGAAAKSIKNKFVALFNKPDDPASTFPTPAQVVKEDITRLRTAGLSQRKAEYIKGLAEKFVSGELTNDMLMKASDEEVMEKLIAVRGLGRWSVEMFACFGLKRMDIFSTGDLGVQRGMAAFFGKDVKKLKAKGGGKWKYMSEQDMLDKSASFTPYRSLFMWYMWRAEDVDVDVLAVA